MKNLFLFLALLFFTVTNIFSQTDVTSETRFNQKSDRIVSGSEDRHQLTTGHSNVPQNLQKEYNDAVDAGNSDIKASLSIEIEKYLNKAQFNVQGIDMEITKGAMPPYEPDWYGTDVLVTSSDIVTTGGYRQLDLKYGEDGWMYLAVNRRNTGLNGYITVYKSSNGGAAWSTVANMTSITGYYGSFSMLVESKNNNIPDSTRIILYATLSANQNQNDAYLVCSSFRRDGSASYYVNVASPSAGNRFVFPSACSDGMFWQSVTFIHAVVREETNAGAFVKLHHFRSTTWGATHTTRFITSVQNELNPAAAFSHESGMDSIYIAVERYIGPNESEIRLFALPETPGNDYTIRYITDAPSGTMYKRPAITIQQRHYDLPQRILVTCTKNDRAVYHFSNDGGATWDIDYGLGLGSQAVDYTSCSSDSLAAGGKDFIASFVDLNGDSVTVRHGVLGSMGTPMYKKNSSQSTGMLAPVCAIYKQGSTKFASFSYVGGGPAGVYYNMESLITGIIPVSNEIPSGFNLQQNYPNPFNPATNIKFSIPKAGLVILKVYDIAGCEVAELVNQSLNAGTFNYDFDASHLSSGVYFYKIAADGFTDVKKMMLVK
jgi:hypothetical protein